METSPDDLLIFKMRKVGQKKEDSDAVNAPEEKPVEVVVVAPVENKTEEPVTVKESQDINAAQQNISPSHEYPPPPQAFYKEEPVKRHVRSGRRYMTAAASREAAKGLKCTWHEWKPAWATCNFCHLPFCFEDLLEANASYYCIEDYARLPHREKHRLVVSYTDGRIAPAVMLILIAIVILYLTSSQIIYLANYVKTIGIVAFVENINYIYVTVIAEALAAIVAFVSGISVINRSSFGLASGVLSGGIISPYFIYQYFSTGTLYIALIGLGALAAAAMLLYTSKIYSELVEAREGIHTLEEQITSFPNIGRF